MAQSHVSQQEDEMKIVIVVQIFLTTVSFSVLYSLISKKSLLEIIKAMRSDADCLSAPARFMTAQ